VREYYPDAEPTPAEVFEALADEVLGLRDEIVAIAIGPVSHAKVTEIRAQRNASDKAAPDSFVQDILRALDDLTQGKSTEEAIRPFAIDPAMDEAVRYEKGLEYITRASLGGMTVGQDAWGVFLETEREYLPPQPGLPHTRFSRLRVHEGSVVQENYQETGVLPAAGKALNEHRRQKIETERAAGTNGLPIPDEQAVHLTGQLAGLKQQLLLLKESGAINIREYLR